MNDAIRTSNEDAFRALLLEWVNACPNPPDWHWSFDLHVRTVNTLGERPRNETFERRDRDMEILRAELAGARARVDWYVKLLCRFWNVLPPDVKASDGRTMRFVHPDPQTALRFVQEAMDEAQRQVEVEHAQKALEEQK
jgi:hypothetical protein